MRAADKHDPAGKVRLPLQEGVTGSAVFSEDGKYRPVLRRSWGAGKGILWIGMNPSTADAEVDDPTVRREIVFSHRWGFGSYVKCNVVDYRATHPSMLVEGGVAARSPENLPCILSEAAKADVVVLAFGVLPKPLIGMVDETVAALRDAGVDLFVLGLTKDGYPRHPLYMRADSELQPF